MENNKARSNNDINRQYLVVDRFSEQMKIELFNNSHKESILTWNDFNDMITELEYHKAKMLMAVTTGNMLAIKEYIADCANILLAIGNNFELYNEAATDASIAHELNREKLIITVDIANQKRSKILPDVLHKNDYEDIDLTDFP